MRIGSSSSASSESFFSHFERVETALTITRMCSQSHSESTFVLSACANFTNMLEILMLLRILNAVYPDTETTHGIEEEIFKEKVVHQT